MKTSEIPVRLFSTTDQDPFPYLEELRLRGPVLWDEELQGWLVLSHDLCKAVFTNEARFAHNYANVDADTLEIKGGNNLVVMQGPEHGRLHRWAIQVFSQQNIATYRDAHIRPVVNGLLDGLRGRNTAELRSELCNHVPGRSMMALMGMDWADDDFVQHVVALHETIMVYLGKTRRAATADDIANAKAASAELNSILLPVIRKRREAPGSDLLSRLWAEAPTILENFDESLMLANARELFLGGFDTTVHALSNGLYLLLTQPDVRAQVARDRGASLDVFNEEVVRIMGVVQHRTRFASVDTELGGVTIRAGDAVIPVLLAANRDPARFGACPAHVNFAQEKPKEHLAYIAGPRSCPGAPLARAEMRLVFEAVLDRLKNVGLDPSAPPPAFLGGFTRSWRPLNVRFDAVI